jgi:2-methylcitrate dehydratase PrpD
MSQIASEISPMTKRLSSYIAGALQLDLPPEVTEKGKHHLLDTIAAMVSGSQLPPGKVAIDYIRVQGGSEEAIVVGTQIVTTAVNAAFVNGMLAHADETDDSHKASRCHPGCGVVPAALAMAEKEGCSGKELLRAVVLGYDICCRLTMAIGVDRFYEAGHSTHSFGPMFGAAAAAGALANLDADQVRWLLSYTAQQASGVNCWSRDEDHIEKAFDFGGMPARNGVAAASMVAAGFTGVEDVFSGPRNFFSAFSSDPHPGLMVEGLGSVFEIMQTNIKKWSVGSPIQAVLDSMEILMNEYKCGADNIDRVTVRMSDRESHVVDNRNMPSINLQHLIAIMLLDDGLSFQASHEYSRMDDPAAVELRRKIELVPDGTLQRRKPIVEITTRAGQKLSHCTPAVRGTPENPMARPEVEKKAQSLLLPVLGKQRAHDLIQAIWSIDQINSVQELRHFLTG